MSQFQPPQPPYPQQNYGPQQQLQPPYPQQDYGPQLPQWGQPPPSQTWPQQSQWNPQQQWQQIPPQPQWQQPMYQQPPLPPIAQPPQKPRKSRKRLYIIVAGIVIVLAIIIGAASQGQGPQSTANTTQATQAASQPTLPTEKPTQPPKPTSVPMIGNQVVLGGTEDSFNAKYGDPISQSTAGGSPLLIYATSNSNIGQLGVILVPGTRTVFGIIISAPNGQPWDATTGISTCVNLIPEDSKLDQPQNVIDSSGTNIGLYQGGFSDELANTLPTNYFLDPNKNLVKPGTFSMKYIYAQGSAGTQVTTCVLQVGKQSTSS